MSTRATAEHPLLSEDALRRSVVPVRSRFGRLFGLSGKDVEAAKDRLLRSLTEVSAAQRSSDREAESPAETAGRPHDQTVHTASAQLERSAQRDEYSTRRQESLANPTFPRTGDADQPGLPFDDLGSVPEAGRGYRGPTACNAAGVTYRQLDYWARTGLVEPSVRGVHGSGTQRLYSFRDILLLKVIKRLLDAGISLQQARTVVHHLRLRGTADLTRVTLMSDGHSVYECTSSDEVIDLLRGGEGVFGIAIGGVWREIEVSLGELPSEPVHEAGAPVSRQRSVSEPPPIPTGALGSEERAPRTFAQVREDLIRSLADVDKMPPEQQAEVTALLYDLHLTDQLSAFANVVDLDSQRSQRAQAGGSGATEGPSSASMGGP